MGHPADTSDSPQDPPGRRADDPALARPLSLWDDAEEPPPPPDLQAAGGPHGPYGPGGDMPLPSEAEARRRAARAASRPTARAGRAVRQRVSELFGAGGPAFRTLANAHAASTAGDTLVAVALANSLFFQVPSAEARGNVALYLLLTVAPFAVIGPLLGRVFDRAGAERAILIGSSLIRVVAAAALVPLADGIWLFPLAFTLLVLSRVHGISRSALLPQALTNAIALVTANAKLAQISVIGGALAAPIGAGLALVSSQAVLVAAALVFGVATWQSMALPTVDVTPEDDEGDPEPPPLPLRTATPRTQRLADLPQATREEGGGADVEVEGVDGSRPDPRVTTQLRLARFATAVVRLLNGFLVLLLAFAFRDVEAPLADFGAVLAAAGGGYGLAALVAPVLERALREEPMVVAALAVEAAAAFVAGQFFGLPAAAFLSLAAGYAWGTAKFAFDGLLQTMVAPRDRGRAFTRSETIFQLAWVAGAVVPTALTIEAHIGLVIAGVVALVAQTLYVSRLLQRV
ncbi:hypothetical protein [Euzebya sp.]|uniref:hypothetical protein n=1 Tax=Euzebya sp. TaxID=1971409 RepID=UPI003516E3F9